MVEADPADIFSSSLQALYDYEPITLPSSGSKFYYTISPDTVVAVSTPDTSPSNWFLHASSIWVSSRVLADHLDTIDLHYSSDKKIRVLELGAGAGLPSIVLAKKYPKRVDIVLSDYPDDRLIAILHENVVRNDVSENCIVRPYAWGSDPTLLHSGEGFDVVMAADTLWDPSLHAPLIETLTLVLRKGIHSKVHLVAGLHTGRYTLEVFMESARRAGLVLDSAVEYATNGLFTRPWSVCHTDKEDDRDRRKWVIWIILRWAL